MNKLDLFVWLESEHGRPGSFSARYTEFRFMGPSYRSLSSRLSNEEVFRLPSAPHSPRFCTKAATNFRKLTLIKNTIPNPPRLQQINRPEIGFFVNRERSPHAFFGHRPFSVRSNVTPSEHVHNTQTLQGGTGLRQEMPPSPSQRRLRTSAAPARPPAATCARTSGAWHSRWEPHNSPKREPGKTFSST